MKLPALFTRPKPRPEPVWHLSLPLFAGSWTRPPILASTPTHSGGGVLDIADVARTIDPLTCPVQWLPEARCEAVGVSGWQLAPDPIFIEQRREWVKAGRPAPTKAGIMRAWA